MRMNKDSGILIKFVSIILTAVLVLTGCSNQQFFSNGTQVSDEDSDSKKESISDIQEHVRKKLDVIETLIDERFLDDYETSDIEEGIYKGVLQSLGDPYAAYYTKDEFARIKESAEGSYSGIGAYVGQDMKTGVITIIKPFVNGPASEAGILPGDILYKLDGEEVTGEDLTDVVSKMKGIEGTQINLEVIREDQTEPIKLTVERRTVEVPTIGYELLEDNIGYIYITEFDVVTINQFTQAVDDLEAKGINGLIIDLRDNGGGVLAAATSMLDRIISKGLCLYTEDKTGEREEFKLTDNKSFDKPLAILINGNSASASEAFAGAIQDYEAGKIIGTTSFGKGIVQTLIPLNDGSAVKLTTSKYYTPKGRSIHEVGIEPDIEVSLKEELKQQLVIDKEDDNQLQKAIEIINEEVKLGNLNE